MASTTDTTIDLTVVVPVYGNATTLKELHHRIKNELTNAGIHFELLFVDDASPDNSLHILKELSKRHPEISLLEMKHNVGQHAAVLNGLRFARGECCSIMDADLQDPPEALPVLWKTRKKDIFAIFAGRAGNYQRPDRMLTSRLFKTLMHHLAGLPRDAGIFVLMERKMVDAVLKMPVKTPWINAMIGLTGMPVHSIPVERHIRKDGYSAYSSLARLKSAWHGVRCSLEYKFGKTNKPYLEGLQEDLVKKYYVTSTASTQVKSKRH